MFDLLSSLDVGEEILQEPSHLAPTEAWVGHIPFAFWLTKVLKPGSVVELGTHSGNSYFTFCEAIRLAGQGGRAFAVDTWQGDEHAGFYGEDVYASVVRVNEARYRAFSTLVRSTFDDAREYFADGSIDLLHVDGLHTADAARHDFETWLPALSDRAVVLFHDTNVRERGFGVWRLWEELSARYPGFAFDHSHGLGVLAVGRHQSPMVSRLVELGRERQAASFIRNVFGAIGDRLYWKCQNATIREHVATLDGERARAVAARDVAQVRYAVEGDALRNDLAWSRDAIVRTEEMSRVKDHLIAQVDRYIRDRDNMLRSRDATIDARDRRIDEQDRELGKLRAIAAEREAAPDALPARSDPAAATVSPAELASIIRLAEERIEQAYQGTTSWRLTRPLRAAMRRVRGEAYATLAGRFPLPEIPVAGADEARLPSGTSGQPASAAGARNPLEDARDVLRRTATARLAAFLASPTRLSFERATGTPDVSVILVLYNSADLTLLCLRALAEAAKSRPSLEIIIFDNGSTDETGHLLDRIDGAEIIRNGHNIHFLRGVNEAARRASGRHLLLLNNDAEILPGAIGAAFRVIEGDDAIGAVGGRLILPDGTLQEAGAIIWRDGTCVGFGRGDDPGNPDYMSQRDVDYCSGALLLTRRSLFKDLGGFDERFAPAYYEETDYCVRLQERGFRVVYHPDVAATHLEFGTAGSEDAMQLQQLHWTLFRELHADWLARQHDPTPYPEIAAFRRRLPGSRRVLVIEDRVPHPALGSGYPRSAHIIGELVALGCDVTLFPTFRHKETWSEVRKTLDARVSVMLYAEASQLRAYLTARRGGFDAIFVCRPHNMQFFKDAIGSDHDLIGRIPIIYDAEAVFERRALLERQAAGFPFDTEEAEARVADEIALARDADIITSVSETEVDTFVSHGATDVRLLGHALAPAPQPQSFTQRDGFVFLGAIHDDNAPNADAVRWFGGAVLPELRRALGRSDLRLRVVGMIGADTVAALDGIDVDLVGPVPDPAIELGRARVFVTPTRFAAGIPHKAHLAASLGTPIVATDLIAGQLGWTAGTELLADSDPLAFAEACARLHSDERLWNDVREAALARVTAECSPTRFRDTLRSVLSAVRAEPPRPVAKVTVNVPAPVPSAELFAGRREDEDYAIAVPFAYAPSSPSDGAPPIAALVHVFYPDLASEIAHYLRNVPGRVDVFLSTDSEAKKQRIAANFGAWRNGSLEIRVLPNRGRDIAPRIVGFRDVLERYELTLQLHSKKSLHAGFLVPWRAFLFETLAGSPETVRSVLEAFRLQPRLGLVAPQHFEPIRPWLSWNGNFPEARQIAGRMGIDLVENTGLDFPSGSMFWARSAALRPMLDLGMSFDDFPEEASQKEGTLTHGMERLFFFSCEKAGYDWVKIGDPVLHVDFRRLVRISDEESLAAFFRDHVVRLTDRPGPVPRGTAPVFKPRVPPGLEFRVGRIRELLEKHDGVNRS